MGKMLIVLGKHTNEGKKPHKDISGEKELSDNHMLQARRRWEMGKKLGRTNCGHNGENPLDSSSDMNTSRSQEGHEKAFIFHEG